MKRIVVTLLACLIIVSSININVIASGNIKEAPEVKVIVNNKICVYNDVPIKVDGSIFLPLRDLLTSIGVQNDADHIIWSEKEGSITAIKGSTKVILRLDVAIANVNGSEVNIGAPPIKYKGKLYIAVGFVTKCFERPIKWDYSTSTLIIDKSVKGDLWSIKQNLPLTTEPGETSTIIKGRNGSITRLVNYDDRSGVAVAMGNKIYVINSIGKVAEYDPTIDTWIVKTDITAMKGSEGRFKLVAVNNKIYIIGNNYNEILEYDPVTSKAALVARLTTARAIGGVAVANGKIYIFGGTDIIGENSVDTVEEYDITANKWTTKSKMPSPTRNVTLTTLNNKIYVLSYGKFKTANIEEYDSIADRWTQKAQTQDSREGTMLEAANGRIYLLNADSSSIKVMEYDPISDKWSAKNTSIPRPRSETCSAALNGKIYVMGGYERISNTVDITKLSEADIKKYFDDRMKGSTIKGIDYVDEYTAPIYME